MMGQAAPALSSGWFTAATERTIKSDRREQMVLQHTQDISV